MFPGFSSVYSLAENQKSRAFRATFDVSRQEAQSIMRGEVASTGTLKARWAMGAAQPSDVIWTTLVTPTLISERLLGLLRDSGATGWDAVLVELRGKANEALPRYWFLQVRGICGPIDKNRYQKMDAIFPGGVFPVWQGLYFDPNTWDGSDMFTPQGTRFTIVTERVKQVFEQARVRNVVFTALEDVVMQSIS